MMTTTTTRNDLLFIKLILGGTKRRRQMIDYRLGLTLARLGYAELPGLAKKPVQERQVAAPVGQTATTC